MAKPGRPSNLTRSPYEDMIDSAFETAKLLDAGELDDKAALNLMDEAFKNKGLPKEYAEPNRVMLTITVRPSTVDILNRVKLKTGLSRGKQVDWMAQSVQDVILKHEKATEEEELALRRQSRKKGRG